MFRKTVEKREEAAVGIDIGSHSLKIVAMSGASGKRTLTAYNIKNLSLLAEKHDIRSRISEALGEIDLAPSGVNLSISGPDVIVRFITLPKMTKEQLDGALVFEAEKYIPFNTSEVVLDCVILGDAQAEGNMRVLLAAAKRKPIEAMVAELDALGIAVNVMDINAFAVLNAFTSSGHTFSEKAVALLDIGHTHTDFLISIDNAPCFMRQIQLGGRDIDVIIARNLSVDMEKAQEYKMGIGEFDKEVVNQAALQILDDIVKEIQLSFGYFENTSAMTVDNIYCSGGMVYRPGVLEYLSGKLGIDVKKWDPFAGAKTADIISLEDLNSISSRLAVGVGLALRG
jgi:type IV pilus assembly protein PilM